MRLITTTTSLALLALLAAPALAKDRNCRACAANVSYKGPAKSEAEMNDFWANAEKTYTGGGLVTWDDPATAKNKWNGVAGFEALCGNGAQVNHQWTFHYFREGPSTVTIRADSCGDNARCHDGSHCEHSGIGV